MCQAARLTVDGEQSIIIKLESMRKIISITQISLDGVMQAPGGPEEDPSNGFTHGGWAMPFADDDARQVIDEIISRRFDMLLGRRTYDIFAG